MVETDLMSIERSRLFEEIMNLFLEKFSELEAIIVSDIDGLIIAGEKRKDIESDIEIVSVLSTMITPILERIRNEFAFKKFGTASFDTDEYRLLFISVDEERILSLIFNGMASIEKISPYAYLLAEKVAQILSARRGDEIQIEIPKIEESKKGDQILKRKFLQTEDLASEHQQYTFKFIVIGDHEVGKTSLLRKFVENKFSHNYRATIGLNILSHKFNFEGNEISLNLWDIGAQQYFKRFRWRCGLC